MEAESGEHYNLKWNSHHLETFRAFETHRVSETLVDVVLFCNGHYMKAHKLILSACSAYFEKLFQVTGAARQPVLIFRDTGIDLLRLAVEFMYNGEVEVPSEKLPQFIQLAESLEIKGLRIREEVASREESPVGERELERVKAQEVPLTPAKKRRINVQSPQKIRTVSNASSSAGVGVSTGNGQLFKVSPPSPVVVNRSSPPVVDDVKPAKIAKTRENVPTRGVAVSDPLSLKVEPSSQQSSDDGKDDAELNEEEVRGDGAAFDLENMDLDHPQHVPPDITVEGPSPELHGLFRGRDQRGRLVYLCGFCQYTATKKTHGIDHVRIHLGDRPFACSICGRKFTRKQHMRKHEFLHRMKNETESLEVVDLGCNSDFPDDVDNDNDHDHDAEDEQGSFNGPDSSGYGDDNSESQIHQSGLSSVTID